MQSSLIDPALPSSTRSPAVSPIFDSFICTEPIGEASFLARNGLDEYTARLRTLQRSAEHFNDKNCHRIVERIRFEQARLYMQHGQYKHALRILLPLWQALSWRKSGWWNLLEQVDWALQECAGRVGDADTLIGLQWELLNGLISSRHDSNASLDDAVQGLSLEGFRPKPKLRAEHLLSCVSTNLSFGRGAGNVGMPLRIYVELSSNAHRDSAPITIQTLLVSFDDCLKNIRLNHNGEISSKSRTKGKGVEVIHIDLARVEGSPEASRGNSISSQDRIFFQADANLQVAPGDCKIFESIVVPREVGSAEVREITLSLEQEKFDLEVFFGAYNRPDQQLPGGGVPELSPSLSPFDVGQSVVKILPKLPKLRFEVMELESEYFVGEQATITFVVTNEEEDTARPVLDLSLVGSTEAAPRMAWASLRSEDDPLGEGDDEFGSTLQKDLGRLAPSESQSHIIRIEAASDDSDNVLQVEAQYSLEADPETPITKVFTFGVNSRKPFDATFAFTPQVHPVLWPSYFNLETASESPTSRKSAQGLAQRWLLSTRISSLATSPVTIASLTPEAVEAQETAQFSVVRSSLDCPQNFAATEMKECDFDIDIQKLDIEDRRPTYVDLQMRISWCRKGAGGAATITKIPIPELAVPFGEPRVLAAVKPGTSSLGCIHLEFLLENPSTYTLTFDINMETSDEFAFSGAKNTTMQLVPLSRRASLYSLMPLVKGQWINVPLRVYDLQFQKTLRIQGTGDIRNDRKGISVWVDADG